MRLLTLLLVVAALAGCAQLTGGGKSTGPSERNDIGKPTTPAANGSVEMPFLTTMSEEDARGVLAASQFKGEIKVEQTECYDKSIDSGHVCNTNPVGGEKTWVTSTVILFVVP